MSYEYWIDNKLPLHCMVYRAAFFIFKRISNKFVFKCNGHRKRNAI